MPCSSNYWRIHRKQKSLLIIVTNISHTLKKRILYQKRNQSFRKTLIIISSTTHLPQLELCVYYILVLPNGLNEAPQKHNTLHKGHPVVYTVYTIQYSSLRRHLYQLYVGTNIPWFTNVPPSKTIKTQSIAYLCRSTYGNQTSCTCIKSRGNGTDIMNVCQKQRECNCSGHDKNIPRMLSMFMRKSVSFMAYNFGTLGIMNPLFRPFRL
jgi:hypothetical protein